MPMARFIQLYSPLLLAFLLVQISIVSSSSPPQPSPTPWPQPAANSPSPKSPLPISLPPSLSDAPVNSPHPSSPLPPPQSSPSQSLSSNRAKNSSGGMSLAKKAGIVLGVIVGVDVVGLASFVYKKRHDNINRSQYRYAAKREIL